MNKFFLTYAFFVSSYFAQGQSRMILVLDLMTHNVNDKIEKGNFVQCRMLPNEEYESGYVKNITDSSITFKRPFKKRVTVLFCNIEGIRKTPRSRIYTIPLIGVAVGAVGVIASNTGALDYKSSSIVASIGLLIVSINGLSRALEYQFKKLDLQYRIGKDIELKIVDTPFKKSESVNEKKIQVSK